MPQPARPMPVNTRTTTTNTAGTRPIRRSSHVPGGVNTNVNRRANANGTSTACATTRPRSGRSGEYRPGPQCVRRPIHRLYSSRRTLFLDGLCDVLDRVSDLTSNAPEGVLGLPRGFIRDALVVQVGVVGQIARRLLDLPFKDFGFAFNFIAI